MNRLSLYLRYLLGIHDCVVIPGIGALIVGRIPARMDMESGMVLPPSRRVTFNGVVTHDDGLLAHSVSRKEGIPFEDARRVVECWSEMISRELNEGHKVAIDGIGTLGLTAEGATMFIPAMRSEDFCAKLGYTPVSIGRRVEYEKETMVVKSTSDEACAVQSDRSRYYTLRIPKRLIRISAAVVIAGIAIMSLLRMPLEPPATEDRASVVAVEKVIPAVKTVVGKAIMPAVEATDSVAKAGEAKALPGYYLIVATFRSACEADRFIAGHAGDTYPLGKVEGTTVCRVYAAASDNRGHLDTIQRSVAFREQHREAWIWKRPIKK